MRVRPPARSVVSCRLLNLSITVATGSLLSWLFLLDVYLSKRVLVTLLLFFSAWGWKAVATRRAPLAIVPRLMILMFAMPFSITVSYLFNVNYVWGFLPARVMATSDDVLIMQMLTVGLVGLIGLLAGTLLASFTGKGARAMGGNELYVPPRRTLDPVVFACFLVLPLLACKIGAPPETILTAAYSSGQTQSAAQGMNFGAAAIVGYAFMAVLLMDLMMEQNPGRRRFKLLAWMGALGIILVFFQILRGDRDSASLIAAALFIYLTNVRGRTSLGERIKEMKVLAMKLAPMLTLVFLVFVGLGAARSELAETGAMAVKLDPVRTLELGFQQTTWTAVLWTNLAIAYEYRTGQMEYRYGQTYIDYAASLVPGPIAKLLNIERPLESWRGPAWEVGRSIPTSGGLHAVVVPFWNFGIFGAFGVMMLWGFLIGWAEILGETYRFWPRLMWVALILSSFKWFWYGDMAFTRAIMAVVLAGVTYQMFLGLRVLTPAGRSPARNGAAARLRGQL